MPATALALAGLEKYASVAVIPLETVLLISNDDPYPRLAADWLPVFLTIAATTMPINTSAARTATIVDPLEFRIQNFVIRYPAFPSAGGRGGGAAEQYFRLHGILTVFVSSCRIAIVFCKIFAPDGAAMRTAELIDTALV
ncbi:hypothetical protein R80B4_02339 [Fibrobacteres bacterium R8-0-B4]